jgi:sulfide:quinone oxidoreductase
MRVLVLGAGFGGLELSAALSEEFGADLDLLLVDRSDGFVFGFSKLDVMFDRAKPDEVLHRYGNLVRPGVRFLQADITAIDPRAKRVTTSAGVFDADILVLALGADLDPAATPGLSEHGHEFYTVAGAFALRDVLQSFDGGRVVVGVTSTPFKCPPAPSEAALLAHDLLVDRGLRDSSHVSLVMPFGAPIPPSPQASSVLLAEFAHRGIEWCPGHSVQAVTRDKVVLDDGSEMPCDLFLGVPLHRAPSVVVDAGMTVDGWIPVDPLTLQTRHPDVYALGDVTSVGTPKAGVFAEGQAVVAARLIAARIRGSRSESTYDGHGVCYMQVGADRVAKVDVTFRAGEAPTGDLEGPSAELTTDKTMFGSTRITRWFG